jgi:multidrug transporter EmrE-like cation transporter
MIAILAGILNGSYVVFIKYSRNNSLSWIWFGFITFFLTSLVLLFTSLSLNDWGLNLQSSLICLSVGIAFGLGMFSFTRAVQHIGVGIPFALNIGMGTISGSLFSAYLDGSIFQPWGTYAILALTFFLVSLALYSISLILRDNKTENHWIRGLIYSFLSGLLCSSQGAAIGYYSDIISVNNNSLIPLLSPWILIFLSCSVIFIFSHYQQYIKAKIINSSQDKPHSRSIIIAILMSIFYLGSIVLYDHANTIDNSAHKEELIWPIFMVFIILASSTISYINKEWRFASSITISTNVVSISLLITSVIFLSISLS